MKNIYLAHPYSSPDGTERKMHTRFLQAEAATAWLVKRGHIVYAPIVHFHELARKYKLPKDHDYWANLNVKEIQPRDLLLVLQLEGWEQSKGVNFEIGTAVDLGIPVVYLNLNHVGTAQNFDWEV